MPVIRLLLASLFLTACGAPMVMPKPPELLKVEKMSGGLMLTWKNNESGCQAIEGERKSGTEAFKNVFSVGGAVTTADDSTATADVDYKYRLRCKKDDMFSEYCSEMVGNPVK